MATANILSEVNPKFDFDFMLKHSRKNCHVKGLNSVVFGEIETGGLLRFFIAEPGHGLYRNSGDPLSKDLTLGFHGHLRDIGIIMLDGTVTNRTATVERSGNKSQAIRTWNYESPLNGKSGKFTEVKEPRFVTKVVDRSMRPLENQDANGFNLLLRGKETHTVSVEKGKRACWAIVELDKSPGYQPTCYSNADLSKWTSSGLYVPYQPEELFMDVDYIITLIDKLYG